VLVVSCAQTEAAVELCTGHATKVEVKSSGQPHARCVPLVNIGPGSLLLKFYVIPVIINPGLEAICIIFHARLCFKFQFLCSHVSLYFAT